MRKAYVIKYSDEYYEQVVNLQLKPADKKEVEDANGLPYQLTLREAVDTAGDEMYLIMYNGKVSGFFGVIKSWQEGIGIGYMLTDDNLKHYGRQFTKYTIVFFKHLLEDYSVLTNYISSESVKSIRWLKRAGVHFDGVEHKLHSKDVIFYRFEIRKEDYE